jgi:hypothetical protein
VINVKWNWIVSFKPSVAFNIKSIIKLLYQYFQYKIVLLNENGALVPDDAKEWHF